MALTQALDLGQLQKVLTSGQGTPATTLAANEPIACPGDSVSASLPGHDAEAAAALLDEAGWTLGGDGIAHQGRHAARADLPVPEQHRQQR